MVREGTCLLLVKIFYVLDMANANQANINYSNKIILAPMVRMNTLPFRLLALDYGADLVYSEELVDHKLVKTERKVNDLLNTIDFVDPLDGSVVFRTCPREKNKIILQIGTADPERALEAAKKVEHDVAAIDINMGCPKQFSLTGGMGAALLSTPDIACNILTTLISNLSIPVSCKIRVFHNEADTIALCKRLEACGIIAIGVHGRTKAERPRHRNRIEMIRTLTQHLKIPVIAK
ncbi:tRNA-dihydrouridine(20) synthase [NAD(P)+]-like [Diaphorina citri]|uniref:tRNA-dihydrouridine(20) synthase [NAD(P)+]-like n=1 Tax=Diaphorina citri TaxID=121845 RepID=A0A3Q0IPQ0_DIACI|nr:tRNA-dihydrouridine(20) synthase [NAD(P)+]-like [Diaphorina citri]